MTDLLKTLRLHASEPSQRKVLIEINGKARLVLASEAYMFGYDEWGVSLNKDERLPMTFNDEEDEIEENEEAPKVGDDLTENEHAFALFLKTCQSFDEWEEGSDGCLTLFLDTVVEDLRKFGVNTNIQGVGGYLTSLQQKGYIGKPYNDGDADEYIRFVPFNGKLWFVK